MARGWKIIRATFLNKLRWVPSGPVDLLGLKLESILCTMAEVMHTSGISSGQVEGKSMQNLGVTSRELKCGG